MNDKEQYDVVVIGGGPAGLSTALLLGRSCRETLVCDSGEFINDPVARTHGYVTQDGASPEEFRERGRNDLRKYDTITYRQSSVVSIEKETANKRAFRIQCQDGRVFVARSVVLATGLSIDLPPIDGIEEVWGSTVRQCLYCHGWESRNRANGVYVPTPETIAYAVNVQNWSDDLVVLTDGSDWVDDPHREQLGPSVDVTTKSIDRLEEDETGLSVIFGDDSLHVDTLWIPPEDVHQRSSLAEELGCTFMDNGLIESDGQGRTSIDGVYVAGDSSGDYRHSQLSIAAGNGTAVGITVNTDLIQKE